MIAALERLTLGGHMTRVFWWWLFTPERWDDSVQCGNAKHPAGPGHTATPLSLRWSEQFAQRIRREVWGCSCALGSRR